MKCVVCKYGERTEGKTTVTIEQEGTLLILRGVPATVCQNCGEAYVSGDVTEEILRTAAEARKQHIEIDVRHFDAA